MGAEAKRYLQDHAIPQLFEGLMTGLIYNKPEDPIQFLENAIQQIRTNPGMAFKWDAFVSPPSSDDKMDEQKAKGGSTTAPVAASDGRHKVRKKGPPDNGQTTKMKKKPSEEQRADNADGGTVDGGGARPPVAPAVVPRGTTNSPKAQRAARDSSHPSRKSSNSQQQHQNGGTRSRKDSWSNSSRPSSLVQAAKEAYIPPDAPIILFMGGPGGGKTRYAAKMQEELRDEGLVHICMPDLIRASIARYKDRSAEWRLATERYQRGELIPNELAQQLVKAEMGRQPYAKAYFVEGFPREARQVEDFERNVRPVDMALILDYDEDVLRRHMQSRGLLAEVIDRRIAEFKQKTLPSAKYFDDQRLLHLIPGEKDDAVIIERMRKLVVRAMRAGVGAGTAMASADSARPTESSAAAAGQRQQSAVGQSVSTNDTANASISAETQAAVVANSAEEGVVNQIQRPKTMSSAAKSVSGGGHAALADGGRTASAASLLQKTTPTNATAKVPSAGDGGTNKREQRQRSGSSNRATTTKTTTPQGARKASASSSAAAAAARGQSKTRDAQETPIGSNSPSNSAGSRNEGKRRNDGTSTATSSSASGQKTAAAGGVGNVPSNVPIVLVIGAPGSSKSKFAQNIAKKYDGFVFISMGELLRRKVMQNGEDELWAKVSKKMDAGEMVPMRLCRELLHASVHERAPNSWGFVVEGYPRTLAQAEDIEAQLGHVDLALLIDCTEQFCKDALRMRHSRDREEGAERADDEESVVRIRMAQFKANTLPMLKSLDDSGKLRVVRLEGTHSAVSVMAPAGKIEGDTNEEAVFANMCQIIENTIFIQQDDGNGKSLGSSKQNSADLLPQIQPQKTEEQSK